MTDLSKLSDAELQALYAKPMPKAVAEMSDDELKSAYGAPRGVIDKLTGRDGGERYQTWPEKAARGIMGSIVSGASLPGDVAAGRASPDDTARVLDMATMAAPVNPAIRAGDRAIPGIAKAMGEKPAVVPTTKELAEAGIKDLNSFRESGLEVTSNSVADLARGIAQRLYDQKGISAIDAPATFAKLKALEDAPAGSFATAANLKSLRDSLGNTAQNFNPQAAKDQLAASRAIAELDQFIPNVASKDVLAGSPAASGAVLERGRGNFASAQRSNDINGNLDRATTGILERAEGRAQAANSGRNIDNTIRSKVESALEKPKELSGLTTEEIAALQQVVDGGAGRNTARYLGNMLGGGGGMGQAAWGGGGATVGALMGGPVGAAVGATVPTVAGAGFKSIANALAKRDLRAVDEMMRKRSPLYEERAANPEKYVISPEKRAAMARASLLEALSQQQ